MTAVRPELLIEPEALSARLEEQDILIVAVCSAAVFAQQHIPNSVLVEPAELISGKKPAVGKLPSPEHLARLFGRLGLGDNSFVVAYDDEGGGWAGRLLWTLDILGRHNWAYLNGGLLAWSAAGLPLDSGSVEPQPKEFTATIHPQALASKEDVRASIDDSGTLVWDVRSAEEYLGSKITAARNGHIPGAIHLDWLELMNRDEALRLHSLPVLANRLAEAGLGRDKKLITHCQTHHRSGLSYLVGKLLGYDIRAYDGSWSEWGNDPETPIVTGQEQASWRQS